MASQKEILIVGGGVIGVCSAYYLSQSGHKITILDKSSMQDGCSYGNAGMIVPSHFIPLAAPGMISQGIRWMFDAESPFYVKPRLNADLISWGLKFYKAANEKTVNAAMPVLRDLNLNSRNLYAEMAKHEDLKFAFETKGLMMLCKTEKTAEEEAHVAGIAKSLGLTARILSKSELHQLEPEVKPEVLAAVYYPGDAHLHPNQLLKGLKTYLTAKGVVFKSDTEVTGFKNENGKITEVITDKGSFKADEIVIAGGSWSQHIVKHLNLKMPLQAGKGYSITMDLPEKKLQIPSILLEARVAMTPMDNQLRIGGTMEIAGINQEINLRRVTGILKAVPDYIPSYRFSVPEKSAIWSGLRPCSPDGLPYVGRINAYGNVTIASGHAMMGLSLAPVTGKLVNDIISGEEPFIDISLLSPERYN
jgi:D-amino-acid dehydrogenase